MINNANYFVRKKNLIEKIGRRLIELSSCPPPDWVETPHNKKFVEDPCFKQGYNLACKNIGEDYRIPWRVHQAIFCANHCTKIEGDFVELGTGKGFIMQSVLGSMSNWNSLKKQLWLYDTFQKFSVTQKGKEIHDNYYAENINQVKNNLAIYENVNFIEGDIEKTIKDTRPSKISFLHVDLNNGPLEVEILKELFPSITSGGIILLDDYANLGEEVAYELHNKFFAEKNLKILTTASGQGIVITG